ncbi:MAG: diguanylate cyclase [Leptospira sp.]|nr:diguanylate cyclase [Leptospira sp.]
MVIYLVTDDKETRKNVELVLGRVLKNQVLHARDISQLIDYTGLRMKDRSFFDIGLVIVSLPGKRQGIQNALKIIRENQHLLNIPLLFVISNFSSLDTDLSSDQGLFDIVKYPYADDEFVLRVRALMRFTEERQYMSDLEKELESASVKIMEVQNIITTDSRSGLSNKRKLIEFIYHEWGRCLRNEWPISLLAIQIDNFAEYTAVPGNVKAEESFQQVAKAIKDSANRPGDLAAIHSRGIIMVCLSETNAEGASHVSKKVLLKISGLKIKTPPGSKNSHLTISIGISSRFPENLYKGARKLKSGTGQRIPDQLIESAFNSLREAVSKGGNQACTS